MERMKRIGLLLLLCMFAIGCGAGGDGSAEQPDAMPPPPPDAVPIPTWDPLPDFPLSPSSLVDTYLYTDIESKSLSPGVREFNPSYELWTDGAVKKRWVYLPPDAEVDTSDMDYWRFPIGTRLWKEFSIGETLVETRFFYKTSSSNWTVRTYVWNEEQNEAIAERYGVPNALGTGHDVPELLGCEKCHGNVPDSALGFSALLLDHDGPGITLDDLVREQRLTVPPAGTGAPYFTIPGDQAARDALGYVHSNCGGCHNPGSGIHEAEDALIELRLEVDRLGSVEETPMYQTTVCADAIENLRGTDGSVIEQIITPGNPVTSAMFHRMDIRGRDQMPEIGTDEVDPIGSGYVRDWIFSLSACPQ